MFEEATNAQLHASLRLCGVLPQPEYYNKRSVRVAAYVKAPMVLSNLAQCAHLAGQQRWSDAEVGSSTVLLDGEPRLRVLPRLFGVWGRVSRDTSACVSSAFTGDKSGSAAAGKPVAGLSARGQWSSDG